jgi:predicted SAM-dependent methyltransferase
VTALARYLWPRGVRRLPGPVIRELKLWARVWLNLILPHRLVRYRRAARGRDLCLHLGCGSRRFPGWLNLDMNRKGDITLDLRERLPFADGSARAVYSEHTLEHFYREHDAPHLLAECRRVLAPGGLLRITVPDGETFLRYYTGALPPEEAEALRLSHSRFRARRMDIVNSGFRWKHQHHYMYDFETLADLLEEAGFANIVRRSFRSGADPAVAELDAEERRHGTLYVEARKSADGAGGGAAEGAVSARRGSTSSPGLG